MKRCELKRLHFVVTWKVEVLKKIFFRLLIFLLTLLFTRVIFEGSVRSVRILLLT